MPKRFDHIDLRVPNLKQAVPFYSRLLPALGFTQDMTIEGWFQLATEDDEGPGEFFGVSEDARHVPNQTRIAFRAFSSAEIDALGPLLHEIGARNIEGPEPYEPGYYAVFFEDPFGNRLEVACRTRA
jgi:catechol 2,3-dioxygenase-like lactoylglutathione lyase family enzyme